MTLPSSGSLALSAVQTEFGGSNPISMSEYYAGGVNVPANTSGVNGAVPSSGTISMSKFYGTSDIAFTPDGGLTAGAAQPLYDYQIYPNSAAVTITCSQSATWTWTKSGNTNSGASVASGGTATSITFTLQSGQSQIRQTVFTVSAVCGDVTRYWTVTLSTEGTV